MASTPQSYSSPPLRSIRSAVSVGDDSPTSGVERTSNLEEFRKDQTLT